MTIFSPLRVFVPLAGASVVVGIVYGLWNVMVHSRIPNGAVLLILFGVMVFLVGLVSEQISALRFEGRQVFERQDVDALFAAQGGQLGAAQDGVGGCGQVVVKHGGYLSVRRDG